MNTRRELLQSALLASVAGRVATAATKPTLGIPGPYPGRVIAVDHPASLVSNAYQAEPVRDMLRKGMMALTGAPGWVDAWRVFFEPGDVVAIKVSPVGGKQLCSDALVLNQIIEGLTQAGVKTPDIFVYSRYHDELVETGIPGWAPKGVRIAWASEKYDLIQHDMEGYDRDVFLDVPLAIAGQDIREEQVRRSYVSRLLTRQVNKVINLPVLKQHDAAGVTIALKNLSHGFVNNVERSHSTRTLNVTGTFIPAVVDLAVFRQKVVLHIVDGVRALFEGGPGGRPEFTWVHKTMYFGTDPVALDKIGWKAIDRQRALVGMPPLAEGRADRHNRFESRRVEHIELASAIGLGVFDDAKIDLKRLSAG